MENDTQNAIIEKATLSQADHSSLTIYLQLKLESGMHQAFGGHVLYLMRDCKHHEKKTYAGHYISRILEIADVDDWNKLPGKTVRVNGNQMGIDGIGHIIDNNWFYPKELWENEDRDEPRT